MTADLNIVTCLVALLAIMNPIGNIPLFLVMTEGDDAAQRRRTALVTSLAVMITLMVVALAGADILEALGITVDDLRIAGGLVILLIGMSMLHSETSAIHNSAAETEEEAQGEPGDRAAGDPPHRRTGRHGDRHRLRERRPAVAGLRLARRRHRRGVVRHLFRFPRQRRGEARLGVSGMNIMVRIMGLLLASIAVGMIATGLKGIFPGLSR